MCDWAQVGQDHTSKPLSGKKRRDARTLKKSHGFVSLVAVGKYAILLKCTVEERFL